MNEIRRLAAFTVLGFIAGVALACIAGILWTRSSGSSVPTAEIAATQAAARKSAAELEDARRVIATYSGIVDGLRDNLDRVTGRVSQLQTTNRNLADENSRSRTLIDILTRGLDGGEGIVDDIIRYVESGGKAAQR